MRGDFEAPKSEKDKEKYYSHSANKSEFLTSHGKNRVSYRFRQNVEFLYALTKTTAEYSTGTDGDERLLNLVATAKGVCRRVHERVYSRHDVGFLISQSCQKSHAY